MKLFHFGISKSIIHSLLSVNSEYQTGGMSNVE